jgi:hypothetical protein
MIAGHFGFAAAVKARETATPLWALMLACVWLDVIFVPLFLSGVETIEKVPGAGPYGGGVIHADYTHSLVGALALSLVLALPAAWAWGTRSGVVVGLVAFSHWVLDLVVHRSDLPLLPGGAGDLPKLGFGLWRWPAASASVELALVAAGAFLYWRAARAATGEAGRGGWRANLAALMILVFGCLVLALDVTGLAG